MKKISLFLSVFVAFQFSVFSQVTDAEAKLKKIETDTVASWKKGGLTNLSMSQTSLVNWNAGGQNSVALNGQIGLFAIYKDKRNVWENTLDLGYGLLQQKGYGLMKTDDRIDFTSRYGRKAFSDFYYAGLVNFKTQFTSGYNYPNDSVKISNFMAPGYLLAAVGLNYIPNSYFNAFISPLTGRMTFVMDDDLSAMGAFGVEKGKNLRSELGGYVRLGFSKNDFKDDFFKNFTIASKLDLFSNYLKNPQYVDVNWENILGMKVNDYITVTLNTHLIYDYDIKFDSNGDGDLTGEKARVQFKEIFGVGFMYKF
ncbi:MAG: DUF3078 domain-containing protein [Paludibacteraceae bacterium]